MNSYSDYEVVSFLERNGLKSLFAWWNQKAMTVCFFVSERCLLKFLHPAYKHSMSHVLFAQHGDKSSGHGKFKSVGLWKENDLHHSILNSSLAVLGFLSAEAFPQIWACGCWIIGWKTRHLSCYLKSSNRNGKTVVFMHATDVKWYVLH